MFSNSTLIRENLVKTIKRCHYKSIKMAKFKTDICVSEGVEHRELITVQSVQIREE